MREKAGIVLLDPAAVRHRRLRLGLTESYLGALCGVTSSVIRRLESGWPQDDLSARFISLLASNLASPLAELLDSGHQTETPIDAPTAATDARDLGSLLLGVAEPVPLEAICQALDWDLGRLDTACAALSTALDAAGGVLVDNGASLSIADDITPISRETLDAAACGAFARRRPSKRELRAVHKVIHGVIVRREDADTATGQTIARLRNIGVLANASAPAGSQADPPILSDDVIFSLMLDEDTTA